MDLSSSYALLELEAGATSEAARRAYKRQVKIWHPDRFSADSLLKGQAEERIKAINLAYEQVRQYLSRIEHPATSAGRSSPPMSHGTVFFDTLDRTGRTLGRYARRLVDVLAPAILAAIRDVAAGAGGWAAGQTLTGMGRRRGESFSQVLMDTGSIDRQRSAVHPGRRIRSPRALRHRCNLSRRIGGPSGPVGPIEGIHPCDAPHRIHKVDRIAPFD